MFSCLNCDTTNIKRVTGFNSYAEATVSKTESIKCKIEYGFKRVTNRNGDEVVSNGTIRTEQPLGLNDEIEIQGEYINFIQVQPQTNFSGKIEYWVGWF